MPLSALAGLALALALALLVALHLRVSGLPHALLALARKERAQDGGTLLDAMKEAVAARSGQAVIAVQTYQEQMAQSLRAQVAEAETRARVAERRAADTATALEAASALLRELRAALDVASNHTRELRAHRSRPGPTLPPASPAPPPVTLPDADEAERTTVEMPPPAPSAPSLAEPPPDAPASGCQPRTEASGRAGASPPPPGPVRLVPLASVEDEPIDDEDEKTRVADRPATFAAMLRARRAPTVLPPAPGHEAASRARPPRREGTR